MQCLTKYTFQVLAWNEVGASRFSTMHYTTTGSSTAYVKATGNPTQEPLYGGMSKGNLHFRGL